MHERPSQEQIEEMLDKAEEAAEVEAVMAVNAIDLVRILHEVQDHRADESQGASAFINLHDWLDKWAASEAGARAAWDAWYISMQRQHRDVSRHVARWEILEPQDQALHGLIAQRFVNTALDSVDGKEAPNG